MSDAYPKCQSTELSLLKRLTSLGDREIQAINALDARRAAVSANVAIQSLTLLSIQQASFDGDKMETKILSQLTRPQ